MVDDGSVGRAPVVEVETGRLQGRALACEQAGRAVDAYGAVPYAAPPVGALRFRSPGPAPAWAGIRDATRAGPAPLQVLGGAYGGLLPGSTPSAVDEDSLTLEIWAPRGADRRPVLVWVPGGAFVTGGAQLPTYDGSRLAAEHDVVVVGVNYRLGAFGFAWLGAPGLDRPGRPADANCGLRDVLAALEWVSRNIAAFGGDPANVTAFGESAGAGCLLHLLSSTAAVPVRRCILQSPGVEHTLRPEQAEKVTASLLRHLGEDALDLNRLQAVPAASLVTAQERAVAEMMAGGLAMPFHPVVDGALLTTTPAAAFADGAGAGIELLVSWTADEMRLFPDPTADQAGWDGITARIRGLLTRRLGADVDDSTPRRLVDSYRQGRPPGQHHPAEVWSSILTDAMMRLPCRAVADSHAANGGTTYAAEFAWHGPADGPDWDRGAFHAIDLPFTFGTLDRCGWREFLHAGPDADLVCAAHMDAWASFASDGYPRSAGLPAWPRYKSPARPTMIFATPSRVHLDPLGPVEQAWAGLEPR